MIHIHSSFDYSERNYDRISNYLSTVLFLLWYSRDKLKYVCEIKLPRIIQKNHNAPHLSCTEKKRPVQCPLNRYRIIMKKSARFIHIFPPSNIMGLDPSLESAFWEYFFTCICVDVPRHTSSRMQDVGVRSDLTKESLPGRRVNVPLFHSNQQIYSPIP